MRSRRKYDSQFKKEAVELLLSSDKTATEVASDLGIQRELLSRWKREYQENKNKAFSGQGNARDQEMQRMKKEIAELKLEKEILKKALAIFSTTER